MREMSFSHYWEKLNKTKFTTFRYQRLDRDWQMQEQVKVVIAARSKHRQELGIARIADKELRTFTPGLYQITPQEAHEDGFATVEGMESFIEAPILPTYPSRQRPLYKYTLEWIHHFTERMEVLYVNSASAKN